MVAGHRKDSEVRTAYVANKMKTFKQDYWQELIESPTNVSWYFLVLVFIAGPLAVSSGINPWEWTIWSWLFLLFGPFLLLFFLVHYKRMPLESKNVPGWMVKAAYQQGQEEMRERAAKMAEDGISDGAHPASIRNLEIKEYGQ